MKLENILTSFAHELKEGAIINTNSTLEDFFLVEKLKKLYKRDKDEFEKSLYRINLIRSSENKKKLTSKEILSANNPFKSKRDIKEISWQELIKKNEAAKKESFFTRDVYKEIIKNYFEDNNIDYNVEFAMKGNGTNYYFVSFPKSIKNKMLKIMKEKGIKGQFWYSDKDYDVFV